MHDPRPSGIKHSDFLNEERVVSPIYNLIKSLQSKQSPYLWFVIVWLRCSVPHLPLLPISSSWTCSLLMKLLNNSSPSLFSASPCRLQALHKHMTPGKLQSSKSLLYVGLFCSIPRRTSWLQCVSFEHCILLSSSTAKIQAATQHGWPPSAKQELASACKLSFHISLSDLACIILNITYF